MVVMMMIMRMMMMKRRRRRRRRRRSKEMMTNDGVTSSIESCHPPLHNRPHVASQYASCDVIIYNNNNLKKY